MNRLANIYRLGCKELHSLWNDKILVVVIIWVFTGGIFAIAKASSQELHNAPIAIVDEDRSNLSMRIANAFYGPYFKLPDMIGQEAMDPGLDSGRYTFVLNIPSDFEKDAAAGRRPDIQVNIDATRMSQAFIGTNYIQSIINGELNEFFLGTRKSSALPIQLVTHVKYNPNLTSSWFGSIMEILNNVTMLAIVLSGAALVREREHGTLEHLLVMPLSATEIMLAKVWSMGLVVLTASGLSLYFVVHILLKVPIAGSIALFLVGTALHLLAATSLGILMGTVSRTMPQLGLIMILVVLPLEMLSGGVTPRDSMPVLVQDIMLAMPTTHFVSQAQAILYRGAGIEVVWTSFLAIASIGLVFFLFSLALLRRSLAKSQ